MGLKINLCPILITEFEFFLWNVLFKKVYFQNIAIKIISVDTFIGKADKRFKTKKL